VDGIYRHAKNTEQMKKYRRNPKSLNIRRHLGTQCIEMGSKDGVFAVHATKTYGGEESHVHSFLTFALDEGKWSASQPGHFHTEGNSR
jgi:hypothetical protein